MQNLFDSFRQKYKHDQEMSQYKKKLQTSLRGSAGETQNIINGHMISKGISSETNTFLFSSEMITKLETALRIAQKVTSQPLSKN